MITTVVKEMTIRAVDGKVEVTMEGKQETLKLKIAPSSVYVFMDYLKTETRRAFYQRQVQLGFPGDTEEDAPTPK